MTISSVGSAEVSVRADAERTFQVLSNLLGNALEFTPAAGSVTLDVQPADGMARFAIRDTGPGISATDIAHVFDRYWQGHRAHSVGSGLGLYIAKGIVEAHGGQIWVVSKFGFGATFYFYVARRGRVVVSAWAPQRPDV